MGHRAAVLSLLLSLPAAGAAEEPYKAHNREGVRLAKAGQYEQAIDAFKKADALFQRHEHHCNIGRAYSELKRWPQAFLFLESCRLRWGPQVDPWVQQFSEAALKELRRGDFAAIELTSPASVRLRVSAFAADEPWTVDDRRAFWLPVGTHRLTVTPAQGAEWEQTLTIATREARTVALAAPVPEPVVVAEPPKPEPVVVTPAEPAPKAEPVIGVVPAPPPKSGPGPAPWIVAAVGVAATGLGLGAWFTAKGIATDLDGKVDAGPLFDARAGDFRLWRGVAYGGLAAGPVLIAAGVLWGLLVPSGPVVTVTRDGAFVAWGSSF